MSPKILLDPDTGPPYNRARHTCAVMLAELNPLGPPALGCNTGTHHGAGAALSEGTGSRASAREAATTTRTQKGASTHSMLANFDLNRRKFLVGSLHAGTAIAGLSVAVRSTAQEIPPQLFPIGVTTGVGRPASPAADAASRMEGLWRNCDECARLGIHNIEANNTVSAIVEAYSGREREFRDELEKRSLHLLELAMYGHLHDSGSLPQMLQEHLRVARFLAAVGGKYIVELTAPGPNLANGDEASYRAMDVKAVAANFTEIGKQVLNETGIRVGFHPEQGDVRNGVIERLMDGSDARYVGFWPDVGHLAACGVDPLMMYKKYRSRMVGTHFRDYAPGIPAENGRPAQPGRMAPFGQGAIDLSGLVAYLRETKFTGPVMGEGAGGAQAMSEYMSQRLGLTL
jgi:inosose dehydratase